MTEKNDRIGRSPKDFTNPSTDVKPFMIAVRIKKLGGVSLGGAIGRIIRNPISMSRNQFRKLLDGRPSMSAKRKHARILGKRGARFQGASLDTLHTLRTASHACGFERN
ncbi:hypothetical protein BN2476_1250014 [Paraburkholderia piptadeniae]|uniref:Uncharacterized protein n=1 Tax=Paraburkholderia piptadeniae TaxID=1701573 RepID=A0A1N7SW58_9BURK|nr:hypothetical protein BN2476_1250014 [Paraburkholderia piptadeniae]